MFYKVTDVLDVQELIWAVPKELVSEAKIKNYCLKYGKYRLISIEEDNEYYIVQLSVVSALDFETIKELITDCQYELSYQFGKFTIQSSVIVPLIDGEIYDYEYMY
ncbi:hypothetical protein [Lysinibacillus endophyticus]|uniref:hypothetical protein n=1 Tax=Ureibacillus endophyticus TaxID=1978490 RepID=UPI0020A05993|nr:hypothetical protein [Lysinibacillus endophyticus]MCP1143664.1 hypothetical protein [Lysinibacillus endophyticus]